jgi:hypothetical protein
MAPSRPTRMPRSSDVVLHYAAERDLHPKSPSTSSGADSPESDYRATRVRLCLSSARPLLGKKVLSIHHRAVLHGSHGRHDPTLLHHGRARSGVNPLWPTARSQINPAGCLASSFAHSIEPRGKDYLTDPSHGFRLSRKQPTADRRRHHRRNLS